MLFCGIDASDSALDFQLRDADRRVLAEGRVKPDFEGLGALFEQLERHAPPSEIGIAIESARGPWIQVMLDRGYCVYPINPRQAAHFRKALSASGDKSDTIDRKVLALYLAAFHQDLKPLKPDAPEIVRLRVACADRVKLVEERTCKLQELKAVLKEFYPAILDLFGDFACDAGLALLREFPTQAAMQGMSDRRFRGFLKRQGYTQTQRIAEMLVHLRWPSLPVALHLQQAKAPRILYLIQSITALNREVAAREEDIQQQFDALPEASWVRSLPGAGPNLAPAILACVGRDPHRFADIGEARAFMGTAPVTKGSGRTKTVHFRFACSKFARRTLQLFAYQSIERSAWARAFYDQYRVGGRRSHAALRAVAHKWVKIILAMQRTGRPYDERVFLHSRERFLTGAARAGA
jgi:transposase